MHNRCAWARCFPQGPQRKVLVEKEHFDAAFHGQCWTLREGWWTYEWCYDKWVRQFHEDKGIFLSEYLLGLGLKALEVCLPYCLHFASALCL